MAIAATAIGSFFTSIGAAGVGTFLTQHFVGRLLVTVASTALLNALQPTPEISRPGISSEFAATGADNPLSFTVGTYATPGTRIMPWMSHGKAGGTPNAYLTSIVAISAVPGAQISRVHLIDEYVELGETEHPDYGRPVLGKYEGYAWIKYYDGSQTAADPMLLSKYGPPHANPVSADMVGHGVCFAICTFRYKRALFNNLPAVVFEGTGIPLYDPRKDDTVGGSGPHRWGNPSTWEPSGNSAVQIYNIARGITLFTGDVWGGKFTAHQLPLSNWMAAMNACDLNVDDAPQFVTGYEIRVSQKPAAIMQEIGKGCGAKFAESAGRLRTLIGPAALPVMMVTDADFIINEEQTAMPFPSTKSVYNGASATYPEPESVYKAEDAPIYTDVTLEAEDNGQRNLANLQFGAVPNAERVQRLMYSFIQANRRFRRHAGTLQGAAALLEPLDTIGWSSDEFGYDAKDFSVSEIAADLRACLGRVSLLEEDPNDWTVPEGVVLPFTPIAPISSPPDLQGVPGFAIEAVSSADEAGQPNRWRLKLSWDTPDIDDVSYLRWTIRNAESQDIIANGTADFEAGFTYYSGQVLSFTRYEAQAELIVDRPTAPTDWVSDTVGNALLSINDFDPSLATFVEDISSRSLSALELEGINIIEQDNQHPEWTGDIVADGWPPEKIPHVGTFGTPFDGDMEFGTDYWVASYTQSETSLPTAPNVDAYAAVTLVETSDMGTVLQSDAAYVIMSERGIRPVIEGQELQLTFKTRLLVDGSVEHRHFVWIESRAADGSYMGNKGVAYWNGLTVADGIVDRVATIIPSNYVASGAASWRLMIGLNGWPNTGGPAGAVQQLTGFKILEVPSAQSGGARGSKRLHLSDDFSNGLGGLSRAMGRQLDPNVTLVTGAEYSSGFAFSKVGNGQVFSSESCVIDMAKKYRFFVRVRATGAGGSSQFCAGLMCWSDGLLLGARHPVAFNVSVPNDGVWREYEGLIDGEGSAKNQFFPGTDQAYWRLLLNRRQGADRVMEIDEIVFEEIWGPSDVKDGELYLRPADGGDEVYYTDPTPFDLIEVYQVRIKAGAGVEGWSADNTWNDWGSWAAVPRWSGDLAGFSAKVEVRTTVDDPALPDAVWSEWAAPSSLMVTARGVQTRYVVKFGAKDHCARLRYGATVIDVPDRMISERGVAVPDTGVYFAFNPGFRDVPVIVATQIDPADGERLKLSNETADGVQIDLVDSAGAGVAGVVNLHAKGYGRKENGS